MAELLTIAERKSTGSHYTPAELARFVARKIAEVNECDTPKVLDPACGDGELLSAFKECCPNAELVGYDLDEEAVRRASSRNGGRVEARDFLEIALSHRDAGLFDADLEKFDVAIANPPYIRTQVLGAERAQKIARQFGLEGRVDIYFAFIEGIAEVLRPGGIAGVIVSNRFMTTKAGELVRRRILDRFEVIHVFDLGDSKLFEAAVLPAVLLLRKKNGRPSEQISRMSSIYTTSMVDATWSASSPIEALCATGGVAVGDLVFHVKHGTLDHSGDVWRIATETGDQWLDTVRRNTAFSFGDLGKIRVGVKTTADKIFVKESWDAPRPELLRPLVTHDVARRYKSLPASREILYTHEERHGKRKPVDLDQFPVSRAYLESHREALSARTYVTKANRQWFEIWVPQQPSLWKRPKLVFQDISEKPTFWMSINDEIVQGDCYWLTVDDDTKAERLWLALAVANSRFIEDFYDHSFHNKLYSGRRRYMTQYVEKFPVPDPSTTLAKTIIEKVKRIYQQTPSEEAHLLAEELEHDIREAFGLK